MDCKIEHLQNLKLQQVFSTFILFCICSLAWMHVKRFHDLTIAFQNWDLLLMMKKLMMNIYELAIVKRKTRADFFVIIPLLDTYFYVFIDLLFHFN